MEAKSAALAPFADLVEAYLDYQRSRGLRAVRRVRYELAVYGRWLEGGGLDVSDTTPRLAEEYQGWLTTLEDEKGPHYASRSVRSMVCAADGLHKWLMETARLSANPFHRMRRVKTDNSLPRSVVSVEELAEKLTQVREFWKVRTLRDRKSLYRLHVMAELLYSTGMRLNELATLELADIDWDAGMVVIRQGKGGVSREACLNEYAVRVLRLYIQELRPLLIKGASPGHECPGQKSPLVFGVRGARALDGTLNTGLKAYLGMTSHGLRHCLGTHLLARGCDLRFIQLILGHDDLKSTSLYTRVSKEDLRGQLDKHHPRGG